jgi:hypothetical protein
MTSDDRRLTLRDNVAYVDSNLLPPEGGCCLVCLSDRQRHIINQHVFPRAGWPSRVVKPAGHGVYTQDSAALAIVLDELADLDLQINGGCQMSCDAIATAIGELAAAIAAGGSGGGGSTSVICGGAGTDALTNYLAALTPEELTGPSALTEGDLEGDPPEGFDTWEEYFLNKCYAAHHIYDAVMNQIAVLQGLAGFELGASIVAPAIIQASFPAAAIPPPGDIIAIAIAVVSIAGISAFALYEMTQMSSYFAARKNQIICSLYLSGSAEDAKAQLTGLLDDAIQAMVWSGPLAPFAGELTAALSTAFSKWESNGLCNSLFSVAESFVYSEYTCPCGYGMLIQTHQVSPYNVLDIGENHDAGAGEVANGWKVSTTRKFWSYPAAQPTSATRVTLEYYDSHVNWAVLNAYVYNHDTGAKVADVPTGLSNGGWKSVSYDFGGLGIDVRWELRFTGAGGNEPYIRKLWLGQVPA